MTQITTEEAFETFAHIVDKLDWADIAGVLDILDEPHMSVIDRELEIAVICYKSRRKYYPAL